MEAFHKVSMTKIKQREIKPIREGLLFNQGGLCAMCNLPLTPEDAVLDHNHKTGAIRGVTHRSCNSLEGKIANAVLRFGVASLESFLEGLVTYYQLHATDQTGLRHPTHYNEEEKKALAKKRRARKKKNGPT